MRKVAIMALLVIFSSFVTGCGCRCEPQADDPFAPYSLITDRWDIAVRFQIKPKDPAIVDVQTFAHGSETSSSHVPLIPWSSGDTTHYETWQFRALDRYGNEILMGTVHMSAEKEDDKWVPNEPRIIFDGEE